VEVTEVADRVRVTPPRKRASAKRPSKKKRKPRPGMFAIALLVALILGFLAKRVMIPSAVHYIAYRPPDRPQANSTAGNGASDTSENITPSDRSELDSIIKRKDK
jgi:hypothetical protein